MGEIFTQFSIVLGLAVVLSLIMKQLRQPLIIGYILTGLIAGPSILGLVQQGESFAIFASLGIALLLFIVGLGLNPDMIKDVGAVSVITGVVQIIFTSIIGMGIGLLLGLSVTASLYIAVASSFSSTIIILRILYEKEEQDALYGRIAIGFLLVQDLVAMLIFVFLSSSEAAGNNGLLITIGLVLVKIFSVGILLYLAWKYVIPRVDKMLMGNRQVLFIFAIGICFIMASIFHKLGFSLELGALVAGVLLSTSPYHREMATRIQPLRDFFLVIFFIYLGTNIILADISSQYILILAFSAFILIGNPLIVLMIMTMLGHTRKTAFFAGLTVAQISEFSLILIGIGISLGHIGESLLGVATFIGLITIAASSYMITYNEQLYKALRPVIRFLTPYAKERERGTDTKKLRFEVLLIGAHRTGGGIIEALQSQKSSYLVIDHDPRLVSHLKESGVPIIFGSADDAVFLDELDFSETKIVFSTIPDVNINSFLLNYLKRKNSKLQIICIANHSTHAKQLYAEGASYVVMPPYISRRFVVDLFKKNKFNIKKYTQDRKKHINDLKYLAHNH